MRKKEEGRQLCGGGEERGEGGTESEKDMERKRGGQAERERHYFDIIVLGRKNLVL